MNDEGPPQTALTWALDPDALQVRAAEMVGTLPLDERYAYQDRIAVGGMGEVHRVHDRRLDCVVAMKVLGMGRVHDAASRSRFINEGTITAQLHHPGIVAVHDRGEFEDGRLWYTMMEVHGETLTAQLARPDVLRRRIGILQRVCDAMAYAHDQGVLHRDLKPSNLMVGRFGEVLVMDWGIASRPGSPSEAPGTVLGTPHYMAPEQARGEVDQLGPASDVYALGVILHEMLCGETVALGAPTQVVALHREHGAAPFARGVPAGAPDALVAIAREALTDDPAARTPHAQALSEALRAWIEGAEQRAQAERTLAAAMEAFPRIAELRAEARHHRAEARSVLTALSVFAPVADKEGAWAAEDHAAACAREAAVLEAEWRQRVGAALEQAPDLDAAHEALADHYAERLRDAEADRRPEEVARCEVHLARHDRGRHAALLSGTGAVTVVTDPPGAVVRAFRYVARQRRLEPVYERELGVTPLVEAPLERGSWLLELVHPDRPPVRYPVFLERGASWTGVRPGDREAFPVWLPAEGELGPNDVYVPAGWFWSGGDPDAVESLPRRRLWLDALVVRRTPVTVAEFEALRRGRPELEGVPLPADARPKRPIDALAHAEAEAVAAAEAARTGRPWRLPNELEFEKYARGVDGRFFAWGDHLEPAWANLLGRDPDQIRIADVDAHPEDASPYGVLGCVGNVREACGNVWKAHGPRVEAGRVVPGSEPAHVADPLFVVRGGSLTSSPTHTRLASRFADPPTREPKVGVRLVWGVTGRGGGPRTPGKRRR